MRLPVAHSLKPGDADMFRIEAGFRDMEQCVRHYWIIDVRVETNLGITEHCPAFVMLVRGDKLGFWKAPPDKRFAIPPPASSEGTVDADFEEVSTMNKFLAPET